MSFESPKARIPGRGPDVDESQLRTSARTTTSGSAAPKPRWLGSVVQRRLRRFLRVAWTPPPASTRNSWASPLIRWTRRACCAFSSGRARRVLTAVAPSSRAHRAVVSESRAFSGEPDKAEPRNTSSGGRRQAEVLRDPGAPRLRHRAARQLFRDHGVLALRDRALIRKFSHE